MHTELPAGIENSSKYSTGIYAYPNPATTKLLLLFLKLKRTKTLG